MLKWFRKGPSPYQTALAMVGVRSGDHVIVVGAADPDLPAELALVTGLNGQTLVVDRVAGRRESVEAAARRAGALLDFAEADPASLPASAESIDILVIAVGLASLTTDERAASVNEAMRVLRPGGRVIVIEGGKASTRSGRHDERPDLTADAILALLTIAGAKATRTLATVGGVTYHEARKPRTQIPV